jgi:Ca-activated chloride channel family protein
LDDGAAGSAGAASTAPPVNPFVVVEHDPLSTFAADVDTASYQLFRSGYDAGPESVRLEEFVNFFDYDYPPPAASGEHPFSIHLEAAPHFLDRDTVLLRVGLKGRELERDPDQQPANLVFLVDVSGSMSGALPTVQATLRDTLDLLAPTDTIAIVTYAGSAGTVLSATPVSERDTIVAAIDALVSGGSTNGAGGIHAAYEEAESTYVPGGINHVLLCTDGDFNVGVSDDQGLEDLIVEKRESGVTLTVLGFGGVGYNDLGMQRLSQAGNGIAGYIGSAADAEEYVEEEMLQTLLHIANDVKLQIEFHPDQVSAYRLLGYETRDLPDDDFRDDLIDAGEVGSGHTVTALYELVLAGDALPSFTGVPPVDDGAAYTGPVEIAAGDLAFFKLRYKAPGARESDPATELDASLAPGSIAADFDEASADLKWAAAVASYAEYLKGSPYVSGDDLGAIRALVSAHTSGDERRGEFNRLIQP